MSTKRQTTLAKLARERRVQERRELKREKKEAAKAHKLAVANGEIEEDASEDELNDAEPEALG